MENLKTKNIIIIFLTLAVTAMATYIILDKSVLSEKDQYEVIGKTYFEGTTSANKVYNDELVGVYTAEINDYSYSLYLYENGTYFYNHASVNVNILNSLGNYVVKNDNTIYFNEIMTVGSDIASNVSLNEAFTLKIKNGNIIDEEKMIGNNSSIITLKKDDSKELSHLRINDWLQTMAYEPYALYSYRHELLGTWSSENPTSENYEEIRIERIYTDQVTFEYSRFRMNMYIEDAKLDGNKITFTHKMEENTIKGTITIEDQQLILDITESSIEDIEVGTRTFTKNTISN